MAAAAVTIGAIVAAGCTSNEAPVVAPEPTSVTPDAPETTVAAPAEPEPTGAAPDAPEPETATPTSVPADVADEGLADTALAFLADELGVPASEITLVGAEPVTWSDASLGCAKEGHAYIQVLVPGHRFTFLHDSVVHDVHTDEQGTNLVRPVNCYDPE